jgi:predicted nucleic acid-binding protein
VSEIWILNASPVITMAKAGYLHLFDQLAAKLLIPEPVAREILAGPLSDPAAKPWRAVGVSTICSILIDKRCPLDRLIVRLRTSIRE